ncbi:hypothetical protein SCP_1102910 [Sparassis crispa]|uniref:Uncharacterized protein n=1 Tax=Sparassis crispa TaxID=139825 RepID=A0A401GZM7_9APHY|nr:hypothetical protein SCP_1102910 [Sparassis crispa]GBE87614.1 hypothetical protein SCP_1102910 [Sparassis crispa]
MVTHLRRSLVSPTSRTSDPDLPSSSFVDSSKISRPDVLVSSCERLGVFKAKLEAAGGVKFSRMGSPEVANRNASQTSDGSLGRYSGTAHRRGDTSTFISRRPRTRRRRRLYFGTCRTLSSSQVYRKATA